jgi:YD repeat-containing protein
MLHGRDDKAGTDPHDADQIVSSLKYDGYGNRISETRSGATTTYTYDAANRVKTSSAGETFAYDANGNTTEQRVKNEDGHLLRTVTTYNAENRASVTVSTDKDGKHTTSTNTYDAVGNSVNIRRRSPIALRVLAHRSSFSRPTSSQFMPHHTCIGVSPPSAWCGRCSL